MSGRSAGLPTHWPLWLALGLGLGLRIALWGQLPRLGLISDEAEYLAAADWLANGRGFAWHTQYLWTRAPLYPLFLAAHIAAFGRSLEPIFVTQTVLSLLNVALTYTLALRLTGGSRRAGGVAALLTALYLPLASYGQLLLSETVFIALLLGAVLLLGLWADLALTRSPAPTSGSGATRSSGSARRGGMLDPAGKLVPTALVRHHSLVENQPYRSGGRRPPHPHRWQSASRMMLAPVLTLAGAGVLLGLATLTRGLTLGLLPFVGVWVFLTARRQRAAGHGWLGSAVGQSCLVLVAFGMTVLPWSVYATRAYGGPIVVDTTGAFNLALGARTAYDGGRSDEPTRSFVLALLDPALSLEQRRGLLAERRGEDGDVVRAAACLYAAGDERLLAALERAPALTQADRQRLLTAEALCLLQARPLGFVTKSLSELVDLFLINYTGDERLSKGFALGRLPPWYVTALFLLDDTLYVLALPLAVLGWALLRAQSVKRKAQSAAEALLLLVGLWLLYNLAAAPLLFAINRFRVPLMPFVFALAGAAVAGLPQLLPALRTRCGAACAALAALLLLVAASPHAYLEPRAPGQDSRWASYLGPYPSSLASSLEALSSRTGYLREQALGAALGAGDVAAAREALAAPELPLYAAAVGAPLLDGLEGRPAAGLDRLATQADRPLDDWQTAVVAGELFRQLGDMDAARRELGPTLVDSENPVAWAWAWLFPPRLADDRIDVADDNDLGYIEGFYLGRYDPLLPRPEGGAGATVRWATGQARLRFPGAATGAPQRLCLRASSAGWPADLEGPGVGVWLDDPQISPLGPSGPSAQGTVGEAFLGGFMPEQALAEHCLQLPARPAGSDLVVTLRAPTFVPDALDLIAQQGPQVGQLRLLAFQLDSAVLKDEDEG